MVNNSSVGQYVNKKYKSKGKTVLASYNAKLIEEAASQELSAGIYSLCTVIPKVRLFIAPVINCAYHLQNTKGDINLKETSGISNGLWQISVSVNAQTKEFHTEND